MIRGFTERYFPADYSYILENHFYFVIAPDYCFKPSLSRIFCVNSTVKVLSPLYEGPLTHLFRISSLCLQILGKHVHITDRPFVYIGTINIFKYNFYMGQESERFQL